VTDPRAIPEEERELVAVYRDGDAAAAAQARLSAIGVREDRVDVGREGDTVASLRAEMHQELTDAWVVPNAGLIATKESMKGTILATGIACTAGALIAAPFALVDFGASFWIRLVVFVIVGILAGGTVAFIAGAAVSAKRPAEPLAAHRGVVLRVRDNAPDIQSALLSKDLIRIDEVSHDSTPIDTLATEEQTRDRGMTEEIADNLRANDDYHSQHQERSPHGVAHQLDDEPFEPEYSRSESARSRTIT
jgi:hypothetical protein